MLFSARTHSSACKHAAVYNANNGLLVPIKYQKYTFGACRSLELCCVVFRRAEQSSNRVIGVGPVSQSEKSGAGFKALSLRTEISLTNNMLNI